jgi:hypothetical protein
VERNRPFSLQYYYYCLPFPFPFPFPPSGPDDPDCDDDIGVPPSLLAMNVLPVDIGMLHSSFLID